MSTLACFFLTILIPLLAVWDSFFTFFSHSFAMCPNRSHATTVNTAVVCGPHYPINRPNGPGITHRHQVLVPRSTHTVHGGECKGVHTLSIKDACLLICVSSLFTSYYQIYTITLPNLESVDAELQYQIQNI